jgi:hypothetical protein
MGALTLTRGARDVRGNVAPAPLSAFAAALSLSAAIAHFGVAAPHFHDWWLHGAFFVACGTLQALFAAVILWRPRTSWIALTGIAGNLAIVTMYVVSRTNGAPVGPHAGVPEPAGRLDMLTTAGELLLVAVLVTMLGDRAGRWAMRLVLLLGAGLWSARATGIVL